LDIGVPLAQFALAIGFVDASRASARRVLDAGLSLFLWPGGTAEANYQDTAVEVLDLTRRTGFVSLALEAGAALVPCYSFGENELHEQYKPSPGSLLHYVRGVYQSATGTILPFLKNTVPLPGKRVVTVMGEPIPVARVTKPTAAQVAALHARYVAALKALYAKHEGKYHGVRKELVLLD
jgi:1-acyl-sn-glycerol-3-phosphate acyltransferase